MVNAVMRVEYNCRIIKNRNFLSSEFLSRETLHVNQWFKVNLYAEFLFNIKIRRLLGRRCRLRYKDFPYHAKNELILDISYQIFIGNNQHFQEEKEGCQFEGAKVQKKMAQTKYIPEKDLFCFEYHQQTK